MSEKIKIGSSDAAVAVDLQPDFANKDGKLYVEGIRSETSMMKLLAYIMRLLLLPFSFIVASTDEHPEGHIEFEKFGPHCMQGTFGAQILKKIEDLSWELRMAGKTFWSLKKGQNKNIISFSVATSPDWEICIEKMRGLGIKRVFVFGLAYTHCVGESAISFAMQGFEVYVIRDMTRSVPPPYGDPSAMDKKLALYGVKLVNYADIS